MSPTLSKEAQTQLQTLLDEQVTAGHMPSVHLTVGSPTSVLFTGRAGVLDPLDPESRQTKPDDTMWFASTSKLITSVIYLQLVDRGLLTLDTDMRKKFAPLDKVAERIWGGVKDGQPVWKGEYKGPVKLGWLLNQSSGFGGEFGDEVQAWKAYSDVGKGFVNSCKVENLINTPITFEPGTHYEYGNGAEWLALMFPTVVGEEYEAYLQREVCGPLGMKETTFYPFGNEWEDRLLPVRWGDGTDEGGKLDWKKLEEVKGLRAEGLCLPRTREEIEYPAGGGGVYSTTENYARLLQHLMAHYLSLSDSSVPRPASPLLSDASVASLFKGTLAESAYQPMADILNRIRGFTGADTLEAGEADWTTGMAIFQPKGRARRGDFGRHAGSVGWGGAAGTEYWIDPSAQISVVWTTQMLPTGNPMVAAAKLEVENLVYKLLAA
ncbi:beta-lactamase/transpeptidase-like protein [Dioszegia hungarica]|uniref:Beta-lactamase/transpeptidase-like protein n=1 Tax=Dioszegia hungarica TaxID=4972 RepID=A0AA38H8D8_9TREE|nr:beta-lactamase/transpeptidase-like protein [Dioszegia hungarica]KAI9634759.1 beta-lactamase/transpeptidase-like protein [Dioszegia hungarica]